MARYFTTGGGMTIGTLADLGAIPDMPSLPTLQRFIAARPDFPVIERGRYGKAYQLDLEAAAAFVREHWRDQRTLDPDSAAARQLPLPMETNNGR
ncbi:MAG: type IV secretion system protein [Sphingomonas sp.]|nr:type IV secretion system protein [Sphingomonas sp.]